MVEYRAIGPRCTLGEGPLWHPLRRQLFWFDIPEGRLFCCDGSGRSPEVREMGEPASAAGWIDEDSLLVATASGLRLLDLGSGAHALLVGIEADNPVTRSNDGRTGPDGSFWIGTMGFAAEPSAGAYYRFKEGSVTRLVESMTIPNATCFAPDGRCAYVADTVDHVIWQWTLDESGEPVGERTLHIDLRSEGARPDGAVCDAEGCLWNAQYGSSRIVRYAPDGTEDRVIELPVSCPTCPAFGGDDLKTLFITSASEKLEPEQLEREPDAGRVLAIEVDVPGLPEHRVRL